MVKADNKNDTGIMDDIKLGKQIEKGPAEG